MIYPWNEIETALRQWYQPGDISQFKAALRRDNGITVGDVEACHSVLGSQLKYADMWIRTIFSDHQKTHDTHQDILFKKVNDERRVNLSSKELSPTSIMTCN